MNRHGLLHIEIEKKASLFRQNNGYSATEPIHLSSFLMKKNVITLFKPLSNGLSGMAVKASEDILFMMVNQDHVLGRQHFTIGHELYHLFIQENFTSQKCVTGLFNKDLDIEELKADIFSACFLLPESGIKQMIPDKELAKKGLVSEETLFNIQHYFNVSMKSVIYRMVELDLIDRSYFDKYATGVKGIARRLGYGTALYEPGNPDKVIGDYGILANQLFEERKISESHYFELMSAINVDPLAPSENDEE